MQVGRGILDPPEWKCLDGAYCPDVLIEVAKTLADNLQRHSVAKLAELVTGGELREICNAKEKQ